MLLAAAIPAIVVLAGAGPDVRDLKVPPFTLRGYYFTFSRMPLFGLDAWKRIVDCVHEDGGDAVILWMAGGFRSRRFPEAWAYNRDHANVKADFVASLIDYAHSKKVSILLGLTPFGYDGVNQMSLSRPQWRATGPNGGATARFGFQSWGYNLCASRDDVQSFMLDYARELCLEFYPNADGLLIESSDYAACHCRECGPRFYDREFRFVKGVSEGIWAKKPNATIAVYPHYFTGREAPGLGIRGSRQPFDPRWTTFYTPHSAHPDAALTKQARGAIWSDDSTARKTPTEIRDAVRRARLEGCTGYLPSFEVFNYVPTEPEEGQAWLVGKRLKPFGFGWLKDGEQPYNELPARVNRIAFCEYTRNPELADADFRKALGRELFGTGSTEQAVADALFLQQVFANERTWCQPAPIASPERMKSLRDSGQLTARKRAEYRGILQKLREVESRYRNGKPAYAEMHRIADWVLKQWEGGSAGLIARSTND